MRFQRTTYCTEKTLQREQKHIAFKEANCLTTDVFEVKKHQMKIVEKYPLQIGLSILHYSKIILYEFVLFLKEFLIDDSFELIYTGKSKLFIEIITY